MSLRYHFNFLTQTISVATAHIKFFPCKSKLQKKIKKTRKKAFTCPTKTKCSGATGGGQLTVMPVLDDIGVITKSRVANVHARGWIIKNQLEAEQLVLFTVR